MLAIKWILKLLTLKDIDHFNSFVHLVLALHFTTTSARGPLFKASHTFLLQTDGYQYLNSMVNSKLIVRSGSTSMS